MSASSPTVFNTGTDGIVADIKVGDARVSALPVQFSLQGAGTLSIVASQTDENGQAKTTYLAPTNGTGDSVITAIATVDHQTYTNSVTIHYEPLRPNCQPLAVTSYTIKDLGTLGGSYSAASSINDSRVVVGSSTDAKRVARAFLFKNGIMTSLGTLGASSGAEGINSGGDVIGYFKDSNDVAQP